ncbi:DUF2306 domain-containing protein [Cohnella herbarum]|uniref:DUF2306 domain-containing protein n=1 Tax=Cohnella herbarum TaxID=2728023 RepID=A0A7Z2VNB4_9BACL|nr:DUF2306 domain-containing protein [Cohnella herbarum]QJD86065.1 DUF2306 domain-containing protein [Cohnella herbarum]
MPKTKSLYLIMFAVIIAFILYVVYANFVSDPQAKGFLSHKSGLDRTVNVPVWLNVMNIHVAFACLAMISGAINFAERISAKHRKFHRINGYAYVLFVLVVVVTSGYMAPYATGGKPSSMAFNLLNIMWPSVTIAAIVQIKKKRVNKHRKWMIRSYAFCFTNMFIHAITFVVHEGLNMEYPASYTIGVYGSIVLLLLLAEIVIRATNAKDKRPPAFWTN